MVKGGRNFVFEKELVFCDKLGIEPIPHEVTNIAPPTSPMDPATNEREPSVVMPTSGPIRFSQVRHRATASVKKTTP